MTELNNKDPASPKELPRDEEMHLLRMEVHNLSTHVQKYHKGNTALLEALMYAHDDRDDANALRVSALLQAGLLDTDGACNWAALDARKCNPMTWKNAVRMFVKQPAERDRILALNN